jgi:hypothetical protein
MPPAQSKPTYTAAHSLASVLRRGEGETASNRPRPAGCAAAVGRAGNGCSKATRRKAPCGTAWRPVTGGAAPHFHNFFRSCAVNTRIARFGREQRGLKECLHYCGARPCCSTAHRILSRTPLAVQTLPPPLLPSSSLAIGCLRCRGGEACPSTARGWSKRGRRRT